MSAPNIYAEKKCKNIRTGYGRYLKKLKSLPSIPSFASAGILKITPNSRAKVVIEPRSPLLSFKEIERQRRSYGNTVSLASLKKYLCVKTRFSTTATTVATGAIIWKPGFSYSVNRLLARAAKNTFEPP